MRKFEEDVFSDLRNLKPGADACLEEPKVGFVSLMFSGFCFVFLGSEAEEFLFFGRIGWDAEERRGSVASRAKAAGVRSQRVSASAVRASEAPVCIGLYTWPVMRAAGKEGGV
jgi:hypothetical protein